MTEEYNFLRPYQKDCCNAVWSKWREFDKLLAVLPTGSGKTVIGLSLAKHIISQGGRLLWLAHRDELIRQPQARAREFLGMECAIEKAKETALGSMYPVTIGSVQSLCREKRLHKFKPDHYTHIVVDETHHILAATYMRILKHFSSAKVLGISATPDRGDKKNLGQFFDELAFEYHIKDAIDAGWLCPISAQTIPINIDMSNVRTEKGDYKDRDIDDAIKPYLAAIAAKLWELSPERKHLIFLPLKATAQLMREMMQEAGFRSYYAAGDYRDELEDYHRDVGGSCMCNAMLLSEGYDHPPINGITILRPTQSRSLYAQMAGRGTRPCPESGKTDLMLHDCLWFSERYSLAHPASLIAEDEEIEKRMVEKAKAGGKMDIGALEESAHSDAKAEREDVLKSYLDANSKRKSKTVDPLVFGFLVDDEEITHYEPSFGWEKEKASSKQQETLAKFGFDGSSMRKGYASKILDKVMDRMDHKLASAKQLNILQRFGYRKFGGMTFEEASGKIDKLAKNGWSRKPSWVK